MLTPFDDYPMHQAPIPIAHAWSGDHNHYDRYFFHGYDLDSGRFFGATMGRYPTRHVVDAAFSVAHDGIQRSVFVSGRAPTDPAVTSLGPVSVEVVEPLRVLRVLVEAPDQGLAADLTFSARTAALEEPRQTLHDRTRVILDTTRLTQWGTWTGWIDDRGERTEIVGVPGTRDRSWGVRPLAAPGIGAPSGVLPEVFWLWAPLHLNDECLHVAIMEDAGGRRTTDAAVRLPVIGPEGATFGPDVEVEHLLPAAYDIEWEQGTRRARRAVLHLRASDGGAREAVLEPGPRFLLRGLGYGHPEWHHGGYRGELEVAGDEIVHDDLPATDGTAIHVQQACRVTVDGQEGVGVLEQLCFGPHVPTGLTGFLDGASD